MLIYLAMVVDLLAWGLKAVQKLQRFLVAGLQRGEMRTLSGGMGQGLQTDGA
jgi:hypothetical protein